MEDVVIIDAALAVGRKEAVSEVRIQQTCCQVMMQLLARNNLTSIRGPRLAAASTS